MGHHNPSDPKPALSLRRQFMEALKRAHRRRPASFYMLVVTPVVLFLAVDLLAHRDEPRRFAAGLILLVIFFGVVLVRAVMDIFEIGRKHLQEQRDSYRDTLGDHDFISTLTRPKKPSDREE